MSIKYLDMFSGIGGFRSGLEAVGGFECIGYCEIDQYARRAYEAMYDTEGEMYFEDATKINPDDLPDIELICGGFPCQAFSIAGRRNGFNDTRGTLFFEIARIAAVKKPALLFLENVPGLLSHDKGRTFATILNALDEIGYDVSWTVLNSANFGVPQARKRVYITGFLREKCSGEVFTFPDTNPKTIVRRVPGSEGRRVYSADGVGITLTASGGGGGGSSGLYLIPLPVKSNTKEGYQFAFPNDSIDISYLTMNSRRGRVGVETAHTLTTNSTQAFYFIDMNPNAKITELARCMFPNIEIQTEFADEDIGQNCGKYTFKGGELKSKWHPSNKESNKEALEFAAKVWDTELDSYGLHINKTMTNYIPTWKEEFELVELFDKPALFTNERLTADKVPHGLNFYHIRSGDGEQFGTLEPPNVKVNNGGTIITNETIDFGDKGYIEFDEENSINFIGGDNISIDDYVTENFNMDISEGEEQSGGMQM